MVLLFTHEINGYSLGNKRFSALFGALKTRVTGRFMRLREHRSSMKENEVSFNRKICALLGKAKNEVN